MTKDQVSFDTYYDLVVCQLADFGITFTDVPAVRDDYDAGRSLHDVVNEIKQEYDCD